MAHELAVPLDETSLTWKYFGDWRGILLGLWAGSMQNMHPQLGAGVEEHSLFFDERWERLYRSLYPIYGVVYDGERAEQTAVEIRGYHRTIKGIDKKGRPYSALNPETFYWAHATFAMGPIAVNKYFGDRLTESDKERLYAESIQWYRLYGMTMRNVPPDWKSFQEYWNDMCANALEDNKATRDVLDIGRLERPPFMSWLPAPLWRLARIPVARGYVWLTVGMYPDPVRKRLGYKWSRADELALVALGRAVAWSWKLLPFDRRFHPRARAAWQRSRGELPAAAPLVQTPARNLPPAERRDLPQHYSPTPS